MTAFYEIVFYLNKQPHSHKLQTNMISGLSSIHFTSQREYANTYKKNEKKTSMKGEIGLKSAWGVWDADYETDRKKEEDGEKERKQKDSLTE